jgi:hypothetical protein
MRLKTRSVIECLTIVVTRPLNNVLDCLFRKHQFISEIFILYNVTQAAASSFFFSNNSIIFEFVTSTPNSFCYCIKDMG